MCLDFIHSFLPLQLPSWPPILFSNPNPFLMCASVWISWWIQLILPCAQGSNAGPWGMSNQWGRACPWSHEEHWLFLGLQPWATQSSSPRAVTFWTLHPALGPFYASGKKRFSRATSVFLLARVDLLLTVLTPPHFPLLPYWVPPPPLVSALGDRQRSSP